MIEQQEPNNSEITRERLHRQIYCEIGRLLLHYQHLELMLKALLPHIHATELAALDSANKIPENLLDSKQTLGPLIEKLKEFSEPTGRENFSRYLEGVTANRNELVHKFTMLEFGGLNTESKCNQALVYLKSHHEFALPLRVLLTTYLQTWINLPIDEK